MASIPSNGYAEVMAGTNNYSGSNSFDGSCPRTAIPPVIGNDLCNKTYVDNASGGGLIGLLTDKGSLITGDGTTAVIFDQNPYQTALTTTTVYDWNALAIGQVRTFTTTVPTLIPIGAAITITYSGTDSIKGTVGSVVGTTITITITNLASAAYVATTVYTSTPPAGVIAGSQPPPSFFLDIDPTVSTPNPPIIPANTMITDGISFIHTNITPTNFTVNLFTPSSVLLGTSTPAASTAFPTPNAFQFSSGAFVSAATLFQLQIASLTQSVNFQYPVGGSFAPPDYCGQLNGYSLAYSTGSIVIDDDIALIADPLSSTGLAWGVVGSSGGGGSVSSVSGGTNIIMTGTLANPIVNLRNPLTAELNMGSQSLRDSASAVGTSGQLLSAGTGGQTLWTNAPSTNPTITDTNTNATYYPTFVAGSGTQPLLADISTGPISLNPSNGNFNVVDTLKLTQTEIAVGKNAGITAQGGGAVAIGVGAGNFTQNVNAVAVGVGAGQNNQSGGGVAIGSLAGQTTQGTNSVAIGSSAGNNLQNVTAVAIGSSAGQSSQGSNTVAIGNTAGNNTQGTGAVAIGLQAGQTSQSTNAVAIGLSAGTTTQGNAGVAIGGNAGNNNQGASSVAIGLQAGQTSQSANAVAIGLSAGTTTQASSAVAIGNSAGNNNQGGSAIAIGLQAGQTSQTAACIAIGVSAGNANQATNAIAIGQNAGLTNQSTTTVAIGQGAGQTTQGIASVAIGLQAGQTTQSANAVAIGNRAGITSQATESVAIGNRAGETQGTKSVAIGTFAGFSTSSNTISIGDNAGSNGQNARCIALGQFAGQFGQQSDAVAIGDFAGTVGQGSGAIAIGKDAGRGVFSFPVITNKQGANAVAIGNASGQNSQGSGAVAIGANAGQGTTTGQGANAIAIGNNAGVASQTAGSICLNATGSALNPNQVGLFINPIRSITGNQNQQLQYNPTTFEVSSFPNSNNVVMEDFDMFDTTTNFYGNRLSFAETGNGSVSYYQGVYEATILAGAQYRRGVIQMASGTANPSSTILLTDLLFSFANISKVTFGIVPHTNENLSITPVPAGNTTYAVGISDVASSLGNQTADTVIWRMTSASATIPAWQFVINNVVQYTLTITPTNMTAKWCRAEINVNYGGSSTATVSGTWYNLTDGTSETTGTYTITAGTGFPAALTTPNTVGIYMSCYSNNATNKYMGVDYVEVQQPNLYPVGSGTTDTTGR
jgi:hypothetical protein